MIAEWQDVLPVQSVCLTVPVVLPDEYDTPPAVRRREWMRQFAERKLAEAQHDQTTGGAVPSRAPPDQASGA
jgi:hypothetical protein